MNRKKENLNRYLILCIAMVHTFFGCTEPFDVPIEDFEEILVIDAFITNEFKTQEIFLSRTFISGEEIQFENNALVQVTDDVGNVFSFQETEPGKYTSSSAFGASADRMYSLSVTTQNGSSFTAGPTQITGDGILDEVFASVTTSENGQEGLSILANGRGIGENAMFFRYDYIETFEIRSPFTSPSDLVVVSQTPPILNVVPKTREEEVCYQTTNSQDIIIASSQDLSQNQIQNFEVKFIPSDDFSLRNRYSILVNQYVQSSLAQNFYQGLREFSNVRTFFAQTQPGFVQGNIEPVGDVGERVLGIFEVASVSSQRIFIDRGDFFSNEERARHIVECNSLELLAGSEMLFDLINNETHKLFDQGLGSFFVVETGCVDCTLFGSNVRPDFWED